MHAPLTIDEAPPRLAQQRLRKLWLHPTMVTLPVSGVAQLLLVSPPDGRCCDTGAPPPCLPGDVPFC